MVTGSIHRGGARHPRLVVCVSHPIAYFCAQHAEVALDPRLDLQVLFAVRTGAAPYRDPEFGTLVDPGLGPTLARLPHRFLSDSLDLGSERQIRPRQILAALEAIDADVVLIYGLHRRISRVSLVWALWRRRPVAYISDSEDRGVRSTPVAVAVLKRLAAALVLRTVERLLAVGTANEAFYRRRRVPVARIVRVPFPIDRAGFDARSRDRGRIDALRSEHGLDGVRIVLSSGKLVPRKRQGDLIDALAGSRHRSTTALVLVGDGDDRRQLEERAARLGVQLVVTGFRPPSELPDWYRLADVYAHVSDFDPHPLAVSEAVYAGLPVVIGDRTGSWGPDDDVVPGENGLVVPCGDVTAIAAALDQLLGDDLTRQRMAAASAVRGRHLQDVAHSGFVAQLVDVAQTGRRRRWL